MRAVRFPFVAIVALITLSGCVGTDNASRLASGSTAAIASAPVPVAVASPPALDPAPDAVGVMPGDLLIAPGRERASTNPYAVLEQPVRVARTTSTRRSVAQRAPARSPAAASNDAAQTSTFAMAPTSGGRRAIGASDTNDQSLALRSRMIPLADVEAQAAVEQRAQENRDRRFDAQVKRASGSICDGCLSSPARRPTRYDRIRPDADD